MNAGERGRPIGRVGVMMTKKKKTTAVAVWVFGDETFDVTGRPYQQVLPQSRPPPRSPLWRAQTTKTDLHWVGLSS